ncbi:hypothetical protein GGX14DRAFT_550479 [Mycena pura]|uniref:Polyketide synthase n=1 Tax=Mycena pura TaxID=153505 RepID=A0AAD6VJW3_9AGAR|nr:hypothetical protein GGX14DRAFT_550479 [Mycena pura]
MSLVSQNIRSKIPLQGAFLKNASTFDNIAFGVSTRDARVAPFSARRLMDLSFCALQDAGIDSRGKPIGCFMSGNKALADQNPIDADGGFAWLPYFLSNRISYALDLTGPSVTLDTACSSSLTALHLAISAIERGDCIAALVGAAQINRDPMEWATYAQGGLLASDGKCKPLDQAADGFGRGEGAVVLVLKPLNSAIQDRDHIYSVIAASAIKSTGSRLPVNVPNGATQRECAYEAYRRAGLQPQVADYVELHATGTAVGDPIELNVATSVFGASNPTFMGALKGNLGHLEVAAFLAAVLKACLMFEHNCIPPTVNLSNPLPGILSDEHNSVVPLVPTPLGCRSAHGRRTISLLGAGLGGATGHVILQSPPATADLVSLPTAPEVLFLIGGLSAAAVARISEGVVGLESDVQKHAVALARRARQLPWRTWFKMPAHPADKPPPPASRIPESTPPIIFFFSGQGPQHIDMGRELFAQYPVFRKTVLELDVVYLRRVGTSLIEASGLFSAARPVHDSGSAWPAIITLPAICAVQIALVDLLASIGIVPDLMFGHSAGETAALYASGAGPKEMAMEIAIARGEAMRHAEGEHLGMAMLACNATRAAELVQRVLASHEQKGGVLELTCYNSHESLAISGTAPHLDDLVELAQTEGIFAQRLRTLVPGHSSFMDPIRNMYQEKMRDIWAGYLGAHIPSVPVLSTCRQDVTTENAFVNEFTPEYLWDNARNAVQFSAVALHSLTSHPNAIYVEISSHPVLSSSIIAHGVQESQVLCPMRRSSKRNPTNEFRALLEFIGKLSLLGVNTIDLSGFYGELTAPLYNKAVEHPLKPRTIPPPKYLTSSHSTPGGDFHGPLATGCLKLNQSTHPDLAQHIINDEPIFPATGFIEIVLEAGANCLWNIEFKSILSLSGQDDVGISLQYLDERWAIVSNARSTSRREHARGCMTFSALVDETPSIADNVEELWGRLPQLDLHDFYRFLQPLFGYGPSFRRVMRCHGGPSQAIAEIMGLTMEESSRGFLLHPALLDACLHILLHPAISKNERDVMYLPSQLEHFTLHRRNYDRTNWLSYISLRTWTPKTRTYDIFVADSSGLAICELRGLTVQEYSNTAPLVVTRRFEPALQPVDADVEIPSFNAEFAARDDKENLDCLYSVLDGCAAEMLQKCDDKISRQRYFSFARRAIEERTIHVLNPERLRFLQERWPHHFEITRRVEAVHKSVFSSPRSAIDALYADELMSQFYAREHQPSRVGEEVATAFSCLLKAIQQSGKRFIRVLEVGAGTGLLTYQLIETLSRHQDLLIQYTVSDISYSLASRLAHALPHDFLVAKAYNIAEDPETQGIPLHTYDIIVSLFVLHAAPHLSRCLSSLRSLLVPGGVLLTAELDGTAWAENRIGTLWHDCIFGSFQEWFGFQDGREHPTMAPTAWKDALAEAGFDNVQVSTEAATNAREFFFVARRPASKQLISNTSSPPISQYHFRCGEEFELQGWLCGFERSDPQTVFITVSSGADADVADGICVALRKELPLWRINLCIFESAAQISAATQWISAHQQLFASGEDVVHFDANGRTKVSRVVLSPPPVCADDPQYHPSLRFRGDAAYVLLGGAGGLGVDLAVWMYQRGARHLILTSRRGINSFDPLLDALDLAKVCFLQRQPDVVLRIESCNATNCTQMQNLLCSLSAPLAGAFLMTLVLDDAPFLAQTRASFERVVDSKLRAFEIFADLVQLEELDFFVAFSSLSGLIGLPGQANYASACTALNGRLANYSNAFSLITPGIRDVGYLTREGSQHVANRDALASLTAQELWACLEDALRKLYCTPFDQYIPDLDWNAIDDNFHLPRSSGHLRKHLRPVGSPLTAPNEQTHRALLRAVLELLEVLEADFDPQQPFTTYGLESLGATKLSALLRPYAVFTQTQLLGATSWMQVEAEITSGVAPCGPCDLDADAATATVRDALGISREDFSGDLALASYGLDSLSATRLATSLQPHLEVTQMQLLGQATWNELLVTRHNSRRLRPSPAATTNSNSNSATEHLIAIRNGRGFGPPLICIPGGNGTAAPFFGLSTSGTKDVWALQVTETTPMSSLSELAEFWKRQIYKRRAHGPYRIAAYSAGTVLSVLLVKMLETDGHAVEQLIFIDYSPGLWANESAEALLRERSMEELIHLSDISVVDMLRNDPSVSPEAVANYQAAVDGLNGTLCRTRDEVRWSRLTMRIVFEFLHQFYVLGQANSRPQDIFIQTFRAWLKATSAPMLVIVAENGMTRSFPGGNVPDLGASQLGKQVVVKVVPGVGHYGIFNDKQLGVDLDL